MGSLKIDRFKGIHNTNPPRSIPNEALTDAIDVDLNDAGNLLQRPGYTLALSTPVLSSYTAKDGNSFLVSDNALFRINPDLSLAGIAPCHATEFADKDRYLFTNDGLMVFEDEAVNIVVPAPSAPAVMLVSGAMEAGFYNIVTTQISPDGLMSGTSPVVTVRLSANAGINVIPDVFPGYTVRTWITEAYNDEMTGGEVFYAANSAQLPDVFLAADRFPANADKLELFNDRLWASVVFEGHTAIFYSQRNHWHLWDYGKNFVIIPGRVLDMKSTKTHLIVGTSTEIYAVDLNSSNKLADYGIVPGRAMAVAPKANEADTVYLHSTRGICKALPFVNLTENKCSLPVGATCSTAIVQQRGFEQFVALRGGESKEFNQFFNHTP